MPFHVNAPLALSSNRRDVWRASRLRDADGAATELAEWNAQLEAISAELEQTEEKWLELAERA